MKIVLAEVPYTKDRDISVEKSCVPEGAELTMAVFDEHAENNDAFYAEIKDADIIIDGYVHFGKKEIDAMDHCKVISFQSTGYNEECNHISKTWQDFVSKRPDHAYRIRIRLSIH